MPVLSVLSHPNNGNFVFIAQHTLHVFLLLKTPLKEQIFKPNIYSLIVKFEPKKEDLKNSKKDL